MSLLISEIYDALSPRAEKARSAASALTIRESRFGKIEAELALVKGDLLVLKWMTGFALALLSAFALKLFLH